MKQTASANQRPVDVELEVKKNMALCLAKKPSIMDMSISTHLHYVALLMDCDTPYQKLRVADEFTDRMKQQLRRDICTIKDLS